MVYAKVRKKTLSFKQINLEQYLLSPTLGEMGQPRIREAELLVRAARSVTCPYNIHCL